VALVEGFEVSDMVLPGWTLSEGGLALEMLE
jgi:hypothetical protein